MRHPPIPKQTSQPPAARPSRAVVERDLIEAAYRRHGGNKSRTARQLSISRWTLQQKLQQYGIG